MKKTLLVIAGGASLVLGAVGIVVPILPTTPFLLLAAFCFLRSSSRLHAWLVNHRLFGVYIRNYLAYRAVTARAKALSLALLWGTILASAAFAAHTWWLRLALVLVAAAVTIHILRLRTLTPEMKNAAGRAERGGRRGDSSGGP